jgi:hypothetical protein
VTDGRQDSGPGFQVRLMEHRPSKDDPVFVLTRWTPVRMNGDLHLLGYMADKGAWRVSTAVISMDTGEGKAVTECGSRYMVQGPHEPLPGSEARYALYATLIDWGVPEEQARNVLAKPDGSPCDEPDEDDQDED